MHEERLTRHACCFLLEMLEITVDPTRDDAAPLEDWPDIMDFHEQLAFSCCLGLPLLSPWATCDVAESVLSDRAARKRYGLMGQLKMCVATSCCCPCAALCCPGDVLCCYYSNLATWVGQKLGKDPSSLGVCCGSHRCAGLRYRWTHGGYGQGRQQGMDGVFVCPVPCLAGCALAMIYAEAYKAKTGRLQRKKRAANDAPPPVASAMQRETSPPLQEIV